MTPGVPFVDAAAVVHGYPARVLAVWLRTAWRNGGFDALPPPDRGVVEATIRGIELAGEYWYRRRPSASVADVGNLPTPPAEAVVPSEHELTVTQAAAMLGVTTRRARQLAPLLGGRKAGGVWLLDAAAVAAEAERRAS